MPELPRRRPAGGRRTRSVEFDPEAAAEMVATANYYDDQVPGLGEDFLEEVESTVAFAAEQPCIMMEVSFQPVENSSHRSTTRVSSAGVLESSR